jgi:hypothetical protein
LLLVKNQVEAAQLFLLSGAAEVSLEVFWGFSVFSVELFAAVPVEAAEELLHEALL